MDPKLRIAAITDEFSPDPERPRYDAMKGIGMTGAELRVVWGKNIMNLTDDELRQVKRMATDHGMEVISIASPVLKCVLPNAPDVDTRFQHDIFASKHTFEDQPRLAEHAFEIANITGAKIVRVFSYWRTVEPEQVFRRGQSMRLNGLGEQAARNGLIIGLENEHACNIATASEAARAAGRRHASEA